MGTDIRQGASRSAQISPDRLWVGVFAICLVTVIMAASYVFSFTAIAAAGAWTGVPVGVHWLAAVFIDGAILTYTVSLAVFQARGEPARVLRRTRFFLYSFTAASVVLNFAHTAAFWEWDFGHWEAVFGCVMAVSAPLAALAGSEEVVRLAFAPVRVESQYRDPVETDAPVEGPWAGCPVENDIVAYGEEDSYVASYPAGSDNPIIDPAPGSVWGVEDFASIAAEHASDRVIDVSDVRRG